MKKIAFVFLALFAATSYGQTLEELKDIQAEKKDSIADIQSRVDDLQSQIDEFPGWKFGAFGTVGGNISGYSNWFSKGVPNQSAGNIGGTFTGYANLDRDKYFWKNRTNINLSWVKLDDKDDPNDNDSFEEANDVFSLTSLYGYKLSDHWAASALGEYRTTILSNFNNPGYLDLGIGFTWTPIDNLVVVIHPLNYNIVFSKDDTVFDSTFGTKVVADYTRKWGDFNLSSNLSAFISYKGSDYSNWTWINTFGYTLWKGIGVGFEFGLRQNKQEALNYAVDNTPDTAATPTFDSIDNDLQNYWLLGLNYSF